MRFVTPLSTNAPQTAAETALLAGEPGIPTRGIAPRTVMAFTQGLRGYSSDHEQMTRMEVVRRLARLRGATFEVERAMAPGAAPLYLVPSDTLVGTERAQALGVHQREHLFGGVVPQQFIATKAITHSLVSPAASAPQGWNPQFGERVQHAVLAGYTAFSREDALEAGRKLLAKGPARVKAVRETGGRGQTVVRDAEELALCLSQFDDESISADGVVIEENLNDVVTLSVGQVHVAGMVASYHGTQRLVTNLHGHEVYGGSSLTVVRGDFQALLQEPLEDHQRLAVEQSLVYDETAMACYPGFFASRINYDVAQGTGADGQWKSGVLEQSWRAGGATGAEIAALEAFKADPTCRRVRASCVEVYGPFEPPEGAVIYFRGVDRKAGQMTKYSIVEAE